MAVYGSLCINIGLVLLRKRLGGDSTECGTGSKCKCLSSWNVVFEEQYLAFRPTRPHTAIARMTKDGEDDFKLLAYEIDVVVLAAEVLLETLPIVIVVLLSGMALLAMISPKSLAGRTVLAPFLCYYEDVVG